MEALHSIMSVNMIASNDPCLWLFDISIYTIPTSQKYKWYNAITERRTGHPSHSNNCNNCN